MPISGLTRYKKFVFLGWWAVFTRGLLYRSRQNAVHDQSGQVHLQSESQPPHRPPARASRAATLAATAVNHPSHPSPSPLPEEAAESPAWFPRTATAGSSPCIREPFCAGSAPGSGGCVALVLRGVVSSATGSTWCGRAAAAGAPNPVFIFSDGSGERPYSSSPATSDSRWGRWKALY